MRHMSLFVFSSLFALSLVMALPSKVNGESHSLDLDPLYKMFANGVQVDVHKTSHAFKRCAALLYGLYQLCKYPPAEPGALVLGRSKRRAGSLRGSD
jgi:hypothetical protein